MNPSITNLFLGREVQVGRLLDLGEYRREKGSEKRSPAAVLRVVGVRKKKRVDGVFCSRNFDLIWEKEGCKREKKMEKEFWFSNFSNKLSRERREREI